MRKIGTLLLVLSLATAVQAQEKKSLCARMNEKDILNHMDIGVNVGTVGVGIDVAVPVGKYVRVRAGYNYMPRFTLHTDFYIETSQGGSIKNLIEKVGKIDAKLAEYGVDINSEGLREYKEKFDKFQKIEAKDYVTMGLSPNLHQFKFLVDIMPFKNKHWSFTAGFFVGPSEVGDACNLECETTLLEAINTYNNIYADYPEHGINGTYLHAIGNAKDDPFYRYGMAGFCLGTFADGDKAMMVPGEGNTVQAEMKVSKIRPYIGASFNTSLSRNKKWKLNVDAGILFLCGKPEVLVNNVYKFDASKLVLTDEGYYVSGIGVDEYDKYYGEMVRNDWNGTTEKYINCSNVQNNVDLMRDLNGIPGKVGDMVDLISKFKVYPNISVSFSYRLY